MKQGESQGIRGVTGYEVRWNFGDRTPPEGVRRKGRSPYTRKETCLHGAQRMAARGAHAVAWRLWNRGDNEVIGDYAPPGQEKAEQRAGQPSTDAHPGGSG